MIDQDMRYPATESGSAGNRDAGARTPYVGAWRRGRSLARLALALTIVAGIAAADEYPTHPIRLLVGFPGRPGHQLPALGAASVDPDGPAGGRRKPPRWVRRARREAGVAGVDIGAFSGVAAPAKTPRPVIDLLNRHLNSILQEPETRATFLAQGYDPAGGSPEDFHRVLADEVATWSRVIRAVDIRFE